MVDTLVVAEHRNGTLRDITGEAVAAASAIASGPVGLLLIAPEPGELVDSMAFDGVQTVYTLAHEQPFNHDVYTQAITRVTQEEAPNLILAGNTVNGLDYIPAVASVLDWPLVTDAIDIERRDTGLTVTREGYGSKVETTIAVESATAVVSIRPGEWDGAPIGGTPAIVDAPVSIETDAIRSDVTGFEAVAEGDVDITDADCIVSVGRGIGEQDNLELIEELADALGATVAASRPIVDAGWLPRNRQVGQSGKTVTPEIYIAIGISGAVQHVAGMKGADTIIAINDDPDAPIFDIADIGIVDDLFAVIPALIDALNA